MPNTVNYTSKYAFKKQFRQETLLVYLPGKKMENKLCYLKLRLKFLQDNLRVLLHNNRNYPEARKHIFDISALKNES